jgi:excisionase family DNA binding protein
MTPTAEHEIRRALQDLADALTRAIEQQPPLPRQAERLYSIEETSELTGLGRTVLYREMGAGGRLRSIKVGRRRLVAATAITDFIEAAGEGA